MNVLKSFINHVRTVWYHNMYVILDGRDNSVTVSKALFRSMRVGSRSDFRIFVFKTGSTYGFCFAEDSPALKDVNTQFATLQMSPAYKVIGFQSEQPSVCQMLYDFGLPYDVMCRISVFPKKAGDLRYYELQRPDTTNIRLYDKGSKS